MVCVCVFFRTAEDIFYNPLDLCDLLLLSVLSIVPVELGCMHIYMCMC